MVRREKVVGDAGGKEQAAFAGVAIACCMGTGGEVACGCDAMERAVRALERGDGARDLKPCEREKLLAEVCRWNAMPESAARVASDRVLATALLAVWTPVAAEEGAAC